MAVSSAITSGQLTKADMAGECGYRTQIVASYAMLRLKESHDLRVGDSGLERRRIHMSGIGAMTLEEAASRSAGHWKRFSCFCWDRLQEIDDPHNWALFYTHHRDSELLTRSNASVIAEALRPSSET